MITEQQNTENMRKCPKFDWKKYNQTPKRKEYMKKWLQENRERVLKNHKEYRQENPGKIKKWKKRDYKKNKNKRIKTCKRYYQKNREKYLIYYQKIRKYPDRIYGHYKDNARRKKIEWILSYESFLTFWQKPCYYCGTKIETIGLDRIDSNEGYKLNNIIPCCSMCNKMKMDFNQKEFINQCKKITEINDFKNR